jgi:hypothetical protein
MPEFKVKVGRQEVRVKMMLQSLLVVYYSESECFISFKKERDKMVWKKHAGALDDKTINRIGKAIEKYMQSENWNAVTQ